MIKEETLKLSCQLRADLVLPAGLDHPQEILVRDHRAADASQDLRMHLPVVVHRHDHEQGRPDPLEIRILEIACPAGRAADEDRFPDRAAPAVQERDPQVREDLGIIVNDIINFTLK